MQAVGQVDEIVFRETEYHAITWHLLRVFSIIKRAFLFSPFFLTFFCSFLFFSFLMNFPIPEPENTIKTRGFVNAAVSVSMPGGHVAVVLTKQEATPRTLSAPRQSPVQGVISKMFSCHLSPMTEGKGLRSGLGSKSRKVLALEAGQTCLEHSRRRKGSLKCGLLKPCFLMLFRKPDHAT